MTFYPPSIVPSLAKIRWPRYGLGRWLGLGMLLLLTLGGTGWLHQRFLAPPLPAQPQAIVVLGGSIRRELFVAARVAQGLDLPIVISRGSPDPCIYRLFQQFGAAMDRVWLELCAFSTFDNFRFTVPLLQQWGVRRVEVVTSGSHLARASLLAWIMLGSHGIQVDMVTAQEDGIPGNEEAWWKTTLDGMRAVGWAIASQVRLTPCAQVRPLSQVDMALWERTGYRCEHQGGLD